MPRKPVGDTVLVSFRIEKKKWQLFTTLATLNGDTATDLLRSAIDTYNKQNKDTAAEKLAELGGES